MAKQSLSTNFQDDILNSSMGGKRRYNMIQNADGTVSLEDVSTYDQVGNNYGAAQINALNKSVNESADSGKIIDDVDAISAVTERGYIAGALALKQVNSNLTNEDSETFNFGVKDGVRGFYTNPSRADDSFIPFKSGLEYEVIGGSLKVYSVTTTKDLNECLIFMGVITSSNSGDTISVTSDNSSVTLTKLIAWSGSNGQYTQCIIYKAENIPSGTVFTGKTSSGGLQHGSLCIVY